MDQCTRLNPCFADDALFHYCLITELGFRQYMIFTFDNTFSSIPANAIIFEGYSGFIKWASKFPTNKVCHAIIFWRLHCREKPYTWMQCNIMCYTELSLLTSFYISRVSYRKKSVSHILLKGRGSLLFKILLNIWASVMKTGRHMYCSVLITNIK